MSGSPGASDEANRVVYACLAALDLLEAGGEPLREKYPATGGLDTLPLATLIPDPEGNALTKVILKSGVPFATITRVHQGFLVVDIFMHWFFLTCIFCPLAPGAFRSLLEKGTLSVPH